MTPQTWDLLVVGGGAAGIVGAKSAAALGASVLLVERDRTGGDCLWTGCVPSKTLIAAAARAARSNTVRIADTTSGRSTDFSEAMARVRAAVAEIAPVDSPEALAEAGVEVRQGTVTFRGGGSVDVDGEVVRFHQALIATGASPALPLIPGLAEVNPLTSESVWDLAALPERLVVLGGGGIGAELGQAFARLGSAVTLVEAEPRLLPAEDPEAAGVVADALRADGVRLLLGRRATKAAGDASTSGGVLTLDDGESIPFDRILVAVGRQASTASLGLTAAGVLVDDRGYVTVDERLRTSNPRIWAAGDVTGRRQFTHAAGADASVAVSNAILGLRRRGEVAAVPRVTFTDPEVGAVGVATTTPLAAHLHTVTWPHAKVDRAVAESDTRGFTRLAVDGKGRIVGATVVGPRAGESLGELTLAIRHGLRTRDIATTIHAYPTFSDGVWNAAIADVRVRLTSASTRRGIAALVAVRRLRLRVTRED